MQEFLSLYHKHLATSSSNKEAYHKAERDYERKHGKKAYANLASFKSTQSILRKRRKKSKPGVVNGYTR